MLTRLVGRPLWLGIVSAFVGLPTYVLSIQALRRLWLSDLRWLEVVPVVNPSQSTQWNLARDLGALDLTEQIAYAGFALAANLGLVLSMFGIATILVVAVYFQRVAVGQLIRAIWVAIALLLFALLLITSRPFRIVLFESLTFIIVAGAVAGVLAVGLFILQERTGPVLGVLVVGPMATGCVFFAIIAGGLATPTLSRPIGGITADIVRFLLLEVLTFGGLNRLLEDIFELDGFGTVIFWGAVNVVLGWFLAVVALYRRHWFR